MELLSELLSTETEIPGSPTLEEMSSKEMEVLQVSGVFVVLALRPEISVLEVMVPSGLLMLTS